MGKNFQHGPLYEHALQELESAGITTGKGNLDQRISSTVLKLIDIFEHNGTSEVSRSMIRNLFVTFSGHDIVNPPTDDPDEWRVVSDNQGDLLALKRCPDYRSRDGGISWFHIDGMRVGVSEKVNQEDASNGDAKEEKDV